jgi:hypothetical protein
MSTYEGLGLRDDIRSLERLNDLEHKAIHDRIDAITVLIGQIGELRRSVEANEAALQRLTKESNAHVADLALEIGALLSRVATLERSQRDEKPAQSFRRIEVLWHRDGEPLRRNEGVIYSDGRVHVNYSTDTDNPTVRISSCGFYESIKAMHEALKETCNGRPAAAVFLD